MNGNYNIISQQKGKDIHSKVYLLKEQDTGKELIVKIYESSRHKYYRKECLILELINNSYNNFEYKNDFFVMYKEIEFQPQMFLIPDEVIGFNLQFLFFDYLPNFSLLDYISGEKQYLEEIHVKYLCFELLMAIKNLHKIKVCPNNLDISNIMLDSNFQTKIIHFCEAEVIVSDDINDISAKFNNDFFYLGKILAKLISFGKFKAINFNKKKNHFEIKTNFQKNSIEETTFWKMLETFNINISKEFFNFFHILINAKKLKEIADIDNLLKNEWLDEINQQLEICKNKFLNDFKNIYQKIIEDREIENKIDIDLKDIIDINNNKNEDSIINSILPKNDLEFDKYLSGEQLTEKSSENDNLINYNNSLSNDSILNSTIQNLFDKNNSLNEMNMNNIKNINNNINNNIYNNVPMNNNMSMNNQMPMHNYMIMNNNVSMNINMNVINQNNNNFKINNNIINSNNFSNNVFGNINMINNLNNINNNIYNLNNNINLNQNINNFNNINNDNNILPNSQNSNNYFINKSYYRANSFINEFSNNYKKDNDLYLYNQKKSYFRNNINAFNKAKNESKPKKGDFNYLEINIKENNLYKDEDINKVLRNFIRNYMKKIKENYSFSNRRIDFNNITDFSFNLDYDIFPIDINIDIDELNFLDEKYEEKIKNLQTFKIKVELIKGNVNNINGHQYYLIFNGVNIVQENFYEELKILKKSAKSLLIKN